MYAQGQGGEVVFVVVDPRLRGRGPHELFFLCGAWRVQFQTKFTTFWVKKLYHKIKNDSMCSRKNYEHMIWFFVWAIAIWTNLDVCFEPQVVKASLTTSSNVLLDFLLCWQHVVDKCVWTQWRQNQTTYLSIGKHSSRNIASGQTNWTTTQADLQHHVFNFSSQ